MSWLGLDIGGANLKIADGRGYAQSAAFPLWKQPLRLSTALQRLLSSGPQADSLAVTMTGELADCFETKAEGVAAILAAVEEAAGGREVMVYLCDGRLVPVQAAMADVLLAAASNWHVLATFAARFSNGESSLLIDVGSTTCDLIPNDGSSPCASGKTDTERLVSGELVYTGVERSPVCAVISHLPWRDALCPVAQELFASTQDAYVVLGDLREDPENTSTADGRPRTKPNAHARLARAICADTTMFCWEDAERAAKRIRDAQVELLLRAVQNVLGKMPTPPSTIVLAGHGEFLIRNLIARLNIDAQMISLSAELGPKISRSACAHALAVLAQES